MDEELMALENTRPGGDRPGADGRPDKYPDCRAQPGQDLQSPDSASRKRGHAAPTLGLEKEVLLGEASALLGKLADGGDWGDARVRRHERRNILHTLTGLLELAEQVEDRSGPPGTPLSEAAEFTARIDEPLVQAQLVGKLMAARNRGVRLYLSPESSLRRRPDRPWELITVLGNLIDNALDAVAGHTRDDSWIEVALLEDGPVTEIRVTDNGPGVPPHMRQWVFAEGASTKRRTDARGHGLGLALVHDIAGRRAGTATVAGRCGGGAVFTVRLPPVSRGRELTAR